MKAILVCPADRTGIPFLAVNGCLATVPALGQAVVEYWMSHLACAGVKQVAVVASNKSDEVRSLVGNGSRWGMTAEVHAEARELTLEQAAEKYEGSASLMDSFPGLPEHPLFSSYAQWFAGLEKWMPRAKTPDRVGVREMSPGIWVGRHGHISSEATLHAPCWLGDNIYVGPGAVVGPHAIVENRAFLEPDSQVESSVIGPDTFVGRYVRIKDSLVAGNALVDWKTGVQTIISDAFVLCSLHRPHPQARSFRLVDRISELLRHWKDDDAIAEDPLLIKREN